MVSLIREALRSSLGWYRLPCCDTLHSYSNDCKLTVINDATQMQKIPLSINTSTKVYSTYNNAQMHADTKGESERSLTGTALGGMRLSVIMSPAAKLAPSSELINFKRISTNINKNFFYCVSILPRERTPTLKRRPRWQHFSDNLFVSVVGTNVCGQEWKQIWNKNKEKQGKVRRSDLILVRLKLNANDNCLLSGNWVT